MTSLPNNHVKTWANLAISSFGKADKASDIGQGYTYGAILEAFTLKMLPGLHPDTWAGATDKEVIKANTKRICAEVFGRDTENVVHDERPSQRLLNAIRSASVIVPYLLRMKAIGEKAYADMQAKHEKDVKGKKITYAEIAPIYTILASGVVQIPPYAILTLRATKDGVALLEFDKNVQLMRDTYNANPQGLYTSLASQSQSSLVTAHTFTWSGLLATAKQFMEKKTKTRGTVKKAQAKNAALGEASMVELFQAASEKSGKAEFSPKEQQSISAAFTKVATSDPSPLFHSLTALLTGFAEAKACDQATLDMIEDLGVLCLDVLSACAPDVTKELGFTPAKVA